MRHEGMRSPIRFSLIFAVAASLAFAVGLSSTARGESAKYAEKYKDPVVEGMKKAQAEKRAKAAEETAKIRARQEKEAAGKKSLEFVMDTTGIERPASPKDFKTLFHFAPVSQDRTGACWCFSGLSFFESEVYRQTGQKIHLSPMYVVYYEYVEKVRRFVRERGDSRVSLGSEINAVPKIMKTYGIVPLEAYPGKVGTDRYEHVPMFAELENYLDEVKTNGVWDEVEVIASARIILDKYLGKPPETVEFDGKSLTPKAFMRDVLKLNPDDYVVAISTLSAPFYTKTALDVPDNWWHSADYYNLPIDEWYGAIKHAVTNGYTVGICGDTSEPGYRGEDDIAVVPSFDIPDNRIDQDARELRIANGATSDDHCIHIVGYTRLGDHDWYLVKDSSRLPNPGKFRGYIFYRDDYVKLKMLSFMVHKDAMKDLLAKFK